MEFGKEKENVTNKKFFYLNWWLRNVLLLKYLHAAFDRSTRKYNRT